MADNNNVISPRDLEILRRLGERKRELADHPVNRERREAWYRHDAGPGGRPMILAEHGGICDEKKPTDGIVYECEGGRARGLEGWLRSEIWRFEVLRDDGVIEPCLNVGWHVSVSDYGLKASMEHSPNAGRLGARRWEPALKNLDSDLGKLHPRTYSVNRESSLLAKAELEELFAGVLPVRMRSGYWWTLGMTWSAIEMIGLENLMLFMYDNPEGLHRLMQFLRDDHLAYAQWLEAEGLLGLNNENDYIGSGSLGYTRDLPQPGGNGKVRLRDLWVLSESQETVGVGPDLFEEFIFPYQLSIVEKFGKCYYGCCEPVHNRWHVLKRFPNLARVSVSPWADQELMAREFGTKYVFSRKPNPALISTERFDEAAIRADIRATLDYARGCRIELVMKDVHTLNNEPGRLARWVEIAREETARLS